MSKNITNKDYIELNKLHVNLQNKLTKKQTGCSKEVLNLKSIIKKENKEKKKLENRINELEKKTNNTVDKYQKLYTEYNTLRNKTDPVITNNNFEDEFHKLNDEYLKSKKIYLQKISTLDEKQKELKNKNKQIKDNEYNFSKKMIKINTTKREIKYNYEDYITRKNINNILYIIYTLLVLFLTILILYKYKLYNYFILKM